MISEKEKFFDPRKPFASKRPETHEEWQARMGGEVLAVVRSGLYLDFRFLDMALSALTPVPDERCGVLATDGVNLYYQPSALLRLYQENPKYLNRLYLHTVFHCVFRHLWLKGKRDARLWNLACDIAVENVLDSLNRFSVKRPLTWVRQNAYAAIAAEGRVVAAAPAYRWLAGQTPGILRQLEREFYTDDHRLWPKDAPEQPQQMPTPLPQKTWQKIGERMQTELDLRDKEAGDGADALKQQVKAANRSRRSYQDFLRRFCVTREEVHLDPDEFDLNFYTYGLSVYGNMPLIEPLETRESKKIEELALVIDTSYSTSGELVRAFLAETYTLLKGRENFFHRMNLHLIQADNAIHLGHHHIQQHHIGLDQIELVQTFFAVVRGGDLVALFGQIKPQQLADVGIVVHDEDLFVGHSGFLPNSVCSGPFGPCDKVFHFLLYGRVMTK